MELLIAIAALCQAAPGGSKPFDMDYFTKQQIQCQKYYVNCYEDEMEKAKVQTYRPNSGQADLQSIAKCVKQR